MRLVLILSAVGITIVALRIFFALKTAHTDEPQGQKTSREEKTVPANTGGPLSGADARGGTGIEVAVPPAVSTETNPVAPRPSLEGRFRVQCDDCRKEYFYKPSEVLKYEQELSDSFTPHPLFRNC